MDFGDNAG